MKNKQELLQEIQEGLASGIISPSDIHLLTTGQAAPAAFVQPAQRKNLDKLSAVDVMFYIAGVVLFSAIMSIIVQSWEEGSVFLRVFLSAGVGAAMWSLAYYLIKSPIKSEVRQGLINSLLLTGSLSILVGGYIITNELIGGYEDLNLIPFGFTFLALGGVHIGFDRLVKKDFTLLTGVLLSVAAFPVLVFGLLQETEAAVDVWSIVIILSTTLLAYATRVVSKMSPDRRKVHASFDTFAAFLALGTMYVTSFSDYGVIWLVLLIGSIFGIFYLSIISQNKHLLGNGSFYLVLSVITISFKYFSGLGVTASLIVATIGLLGTAAIASGINKKYFKASSDISVVPTPELTGLAQAIHSDHTGRALSSGPSNDQ